MAAAPPANPASQAPAFALGLGRDNTVLDWLFPADTKFNGTLEKFIAFLASITSRAQQFRWNSILAIPVDTNTRELLTDYGRISMDNINSHATTYTGMQTREAFVVLYQEDYMINGAPIGACLFKKIVQLTYVDTMATASHINKTLMDMYLKLPTFQHDIGKFNNWI